MFGFKKKPQLPDAVKREALNSVVEQVRAGSGDDLRVLIAGALNNDEIGPDDKFMTSMMKDIAHHGLPDPEKVKKTHFSDWWQQASPNERGDALEIAIAYMFSR